MRDLSDHQRKNRCLLICAGTLNADSRASSGVQPRSHGPDGKFRGVAVAAEMAEKHMAQGIGGHFRNNIRRGGIGKMTVPGQDPLLHRPGALRVLLQKRLVVVRLDQKGVHAPHGFHNLPGGIAKVGENGESGSTGTHDKSHGICGIVRNGKGKDLHVFQGKSRPAGKQTPVGTDPRPLQMIGGQWIGKHRHAMLLQKDFQSPGVIAVLMGEENARERFRGQAARLEV